MIPRLHPIWRRSEAPTGCRRARPPTAASRRSTRPGAPARCRQATTAGPRRSASTSMPSPRPAPTATSCWSRPTPRTRRISTHGRGHRRAARPASSRSRTATAAARTRSILAADAHFNHPGVRDHRELGRLGIRRQLAGLLAVRDGRRRHHAQQREQLARLDRDGVVGRRQRLLGVRAQALVAARHRMREADGGRRLGRCRPEQRSGRVRHVQQLRLEQLLRLPDRARRAQGLDGWAQVGGTSLSSPLIASVYALAGNTGAITLRQFSVQPHGIAVRRHQRVQRQLLAVVPVHRRQPATTARPDSGRRTAPAAF